MKATTHALAKENRLGFILAITLGVLLLVSAFGFLAPLHAHAATISADAPYCSDAPDTPFAGDNGMFDSVVKFLVCFLEQSIVPFLFALATCVFFWGMVKFISTQDTAEREAGKQFMLWGIIGLAVMFCVWGLVYLLNNTFGVPLQLPLLPTD